MIKTVIVDDELAARKTLRQYLSRYCPETDVVGDADGVETGLELIAQTQPDLVFLDVLMTDGSGFELLDRLENRSFHVIFVTSYDSFAIKAFKYNAADYLLKLIDPQELVRAVQKVQSMPLSDTAKKRYAHLQQAFDSEQLDRLTLPTSTGYKILHLEDIIWCRADNTYTTFHTKDGSKIVVSKPIKYYEELLPRESFLRIHQSQLINLNHIQEYVKSSGGFVIMSDGTELAISKRKKEAFLSLFLNKSL